jgi:hypothetical protein
MVSIDHRGRGLYASLLHAALEDLWRNGVHRVIIAIEASNQNSVRAHHAAGAHRLLNLRCVRLLGFTWIHDGVRSRIRWTGTRQWLALSSQDLVAVT